jgi:transcriptional regulator with XRE-family HTH domain
MRPINPERLQQDVGLRLAELRKGRHLTQQALADQFGVSMRYIQAVEAGSENLTLQSLAAWASVLQVPVGAIFETPSVRWKRPGRPSTKR